MEHPIDVGRLNVIRHFLSNKYGVNVGSGHVVFPNKVNVDLVRHEDCQVQADVTKRLPFPNNHFEEVVFTDVIEHVPKGTEPKALKEIERVLKPSGLLALSTPYGSWICKVLDPLYWLHGHRHYNEKQIRFFFQQTRLHIKHCFTAGKIPWGVVTLSYMLNWVLRRRNVDLCKRLVLNAYDGAIGSKGGTLYVIAVKGVD